MRVGLRGVKVFDIDTTNVEVTVDVLDKSHAAEACGLRTFVGVAESPADIVQGRNELVEIIIGGVCSFVSFHRVQAFLSFVSAICGIDEVKSSYSDYLLTEIRKHSIVYSVVV